MSKKLRFYLGVAVLAATLLGSGGVVAAPYDVSTAIRHLNTILDDLHVVSQNIHRQDEGRVFIIEKTIRTVLHSVETEGLRFSTMHLYQNLIVRFRYSEQFFDFIRTVRTKAAIEEILETVRNIRIAVGLDDDPYSKILKANLSQIKTSVDALLGLDNRIVGEPMRSRLQDLIGKLGYAVAIADQGDRPKAFKAATEAYHAIKDMYPMFQAVAISSPAFSYTLEIMGVNEFIAEYAQIEMRR